MNRCLTFFFSLLLLATFGAQAQGLVREAPKGVMPAVLLVTQSPEITLNGKPDRLSPGARIRGLNNMLILPASITGKSLPAVFRRDSAGLVHEVWQLTPEEFERVGGINTGDPEGYKRFNELLNMLFGSRK